MPTYDYKCNDCGKKFEHFQSMKDEPLQECLCSKKGKVTRLISSGGGIIFKGSGFYVTDYKKDTKTNTESTSEKSTPTTTQTPPVTQTNQSTPDK